MSVTFYGRTSDGTLIAIDLDDPAYLNLSGANARAFLGFLGVEPGANLSGQVGLPEARRAVIRASATFERRVCRYTRKASNTKRPGHVRMIEGGVNEGYFRRRLDDFEVFVGVLAERVATSICWG